LTANFVISSLIVGNFMSVCKTLLDIVKIKKVKIVLEKVMKAERGSRYIDLSFI
jgi:hypothetical protein